MVFPSIQVYQQDPLNWQQQPNGDIRQNNLNSLPPPVSNPGGAVKPPDLISKRAKLTKLPQQDQLTALNCPRCDSTNTKFCYFNNYSLTQPRHFCKTCRRYWTIGGALRNVPVGGGCRRNNRSKGSSSSNTSSRSKSPVTNTIGSSSSTSDMLGHLVPPPQGKLPFYPSLRNLNNFRGGDNIRLSFGGSCGSGSSPIFATQEMQQFQSLPHMQQFYFSSAEMLDQPQPGLFQYNQIIQGEGVDQLLGYIGEAGQHRSNWKQPLLDFGVTTNNLGNVKNEENQGLSLPRKFLGVQGNDQYWGNGNASNSNAWTDLSGFTSSTSHLL